MVASFARVIGAAAFLCAFASAGTKDGDAGLWLARAQAARAAGDLAGALKALERADALAAGDPVVEAPIAFEFGVLKRPERARGIISALIARRPKDADLWLIQAAIAAQTRETALGLRSLAEAERLSTGDTKRLARAADLYDEFYEQKEALRILAACLKRESGSLGLWIAQGEAAGPAGDRALGVKSLDRARELAAGDRSQLARVASLYANLDEPAKALDILAALLRASPDDAELWLLQAETGDKIGARTLTTESLRRYQRLAGENRRWLARAARLYAGRGEAKAALALLAPVFRDAGPVDPDLAIEQAAAAITAGDKELARRSVALAEAAAAGDGRRLARVAELYADAGDADGSRALSGKLVAAEPENPEQWIARARTEARLGDRALAAEALAKARALAAGNWARLAQIADLDVELGEADAALGILGDQTRLFPSDPDPRIALSRAALRLGRRAVALESLKLAEASSTDPGRLHTIALLLDETGEHERARALFERATRLRPDSSEYFKDLGVCEFRAGAVEKAAASLKTAVDLDPADEEAVSSLDAVRAAASSRAR
ncbi:MAG: tetratricopeptide repeat protein [Elusimicrobiota bacterium]